MEENDRPGTLLQPDVMLPAQFFRVVVRGKELQRGELRLIAAVLEDAVECFQKNLFAQDSRGRRLFREAERWMMSTDQELPFSFEYICGFLGLDPSCVRTGIQRWAMSRAPQGAESPTARAHRVNAASSAFSATRAATAPGPAGFAREPLPKSAAV